MKIVIIYVFIFIFIIVSSKELRYNKAILNNDQFNILIQNQSSYYHFIRLISNDGKSCNRTLIFNQCESNLCGGAALLIDGEENEKNTGYTAHLGFQCNNYLNKLAFLCPVSIYQYIVGDITYSFNVECYNDSSDSGGSQSGDSSSGDNNNSSDSSSQSDDSSGDKFKIISLISNDGKSCNRTLIFDQCESNLCGGAALLIDGEENEKNTGYTAHLGFQCNNYLNKLAFLCPISTYQYTISGVTYGFNVNCHN